MAAFDIDLKEVGEIQVKLIACDDQNNIRKFVDILSLNIEDLANSFKEST